MTIYNTLKKLNSDFQTYHWEQYLLFFEDEGIRKLQEIRSLLESVVKLYPNLEHQTQKHYELIDYEIKEFHSVASNRIANDRVKDKHLIYAKQNMSAVLWDFHDELWRYNAAILEKEI